MHRKYYIILMAGMGNLAVLFLLGLMAYHEGAGVAVVLAFLLGWGSIEANVMAFAAIREAKEEEPKPDLIRESQKLANHWVRARRRAHHGEITRGECDVCEGHKKAFLKAAERAARTLK